MAYPRYAYMVYSNPFHQYLSYQSSGTDAYQPPPLLYSIIRHDESALAKIGSAATHKSLDLSILSFRMRIVNHLTELTLSSHLSVSWPDLKLCIDFDS